MANFAISRLQLLCNLHHCSHFLAISFSLYLKPHILQVWSFFIIFISLSLRLIIGDLLTTIGRRTVNLTPSKRKRVKGETQGVWTLQQQRQCTILLLRKLRPPTWNKKTLCKMQRKQFVVSYVVEKLNRGTETI